MQIVINNNIQYTKISNNKYILIRELSCMPTEKKSLISKNIMST